MQPAKALAQTLCVVLLLGMTGASFARGPETIGLAAAPGANVIGAARAPWFNSEIDTDGDTGRQVSVSVDPYTGTPYVSYYDATRQALRVAWWVGSGGNCGPGGSWTCRTVDSQGDVGRYSAIAVKVGAIHVAYHGDGDLKYAESTDDPYHQTWRIRTIDKALAPASTGLHISVQLLSVSQLRIAYHYNDPAGADALKLAVYVGGQGNCGYGAHQGKWQCDTIQTGEGMGQYTSLALDADGKRHIAYYDAGSGDLWYATNRRSANCGPGNSWACYPISSANDVGQYASLYVDDTNRFHVAYYDATADTLMYAYEVASGGNCGVLGSAQCDEIDAMPAGYHPLGLAIAQDAGGHPIIAYQSESVSLNVARPLDALGLPPGSGDCGPENLFATWRCQTIDPAGTWVRYRNGDFASVALNATGLATVAYQGFIVSSGGNLVVSRQQLQSFLPLVLKKT